MKLLFAMLLRRHPRPGEQDRWWSVDVSENIDTGVPTERHYLFTGEVLMQFIKRKLAQYGGDDDDATNG